MPRKMIHFLVAAAFMLACASPALAADAWGLSEGTPQLKSAGVLAFGPDGILLVGDSQGAAIFAIGTGDKSGQSSKASINVAGINQKIAETLGASPQNVSINDIAVNPADGNIYISGTADGKPAIVRADSNGKISKFDLSKVPFAKVELANAPADQEVGEGRRRRNPRESSITDLAYIDGRILVSGLSNAEAASTVREILLPFEKTPTATSIEIYHGAHGRVEDSSPVQTFIPLIIDGEPNVLAGYTCTPLVKIPLSSLADGKKVRATTVAELGNRNRPLDMISYERNGKRYLLMANSSRGVMKVSTDGIDSNPGISEPVRGGGTAGQKYETISDLEGVVQLDKLNDQSAIVLVQNSNGSQDLKTVPLP